MAGFPGKAKKTSIFTILPVFPAKISKFPDYSTQFSFRFEFDDKYSIVVHPNYSQQILAYQGVPEVAE